MTKQEGREKRAEKEKGGVSQRMEKSEGREVEGNGIYSEEGRGRIEGACGEMGKSEGWRGSGEGK